MTIAVDLGRKATKQTNKATKLGLIASSLNMVLKHFLTVPDYCLFICSMEQLSRDLAQ